MAFALVVLAVGSVLAGYVGLPYVMGPNLLGEWLGPVFAGAMVPEVPHDLQPREWATVVPLCALAIVMGVFPAFFLRPMEASVRQLVEQVQTAQELRVAERAAAAARPDAE